MKNIIRTIFKKLFAIGYVISEKIEVRLPRGYPIYLRLSYWLYIIDDSYADSGAGFYSNRLKLGRLSVFNPIAHFSNYLDRCGCRSRGHGGEGVYHYNSVCSGCGEKLNEYN